MFVIHFSQTGVYSFIIEFTVYFSHSTLSIFFKDYLESNDIKKVLIKKSLKFIFTIIHRKLFSFALTLSICITDSKIMFLQAYSCRFGKKTDRNMVL